MGQNIRVHTWKIAGSEDKLNYGFRTSNQEVLGGREVSCYKHSTRLGYLVSHQALSDFFSLSFVYMCPLSNQMYAYWNGRYYVGVECPHQQYVVIPLA